ncbi:MAG: VWA domain-containing protein, partial [Clostridiales bacterium]|nr:VWA domain-containing protein [Clostridiales bacterium]
MKRSIKKSIAVLLIIAIVAGMIPESLLYASAEEVETTKTALDYTIFSGSKRDDFSFSCWRSNIWGDVYTGGSFNYSGSELYIHGNVDAGGVINTSGWKTEIKNRNSNASTIPMPDLDNIIHENAQPFDYIRGSRSYNENDIIINESIKIEDDINFSGSNFMGACYIIAGGDINYNVNTLNQQIDNKVLIYSQDGNIRISGNDITINGILYAPNGSVELNVNTFNLNGRIIADRVTFSGSQFNVKGDSQDLDLIKNKAITKTYTSDQDFLTGELNGLSLSVPNQLILGDKIDNPLQGEEKVYGNIEESNGLKITSVTDKKILMPNNEDLLLTYGLSGFGEEESNQNAVDLVIVMDCSGSMQGTRITNSKNAAKEVVGKMKSNDRCAIVRFTSSAYTVQGLSNDKESLNNAIDSINPSGSTRIYSGISQALDILEKESEEERQKFIILLSDGEDSYSSQSI